MDKKSLRTVHSSLTTLSQRTLKRIKQSIQSYLHTIMPTDNKNIINQASDAVAGGIDNVRGAIHDMTKSSNDKPIGEKINDNTPNSAKEAGKNVGGMVDDGAKATKNKFNEVTK